MLGLAFAEAHRSHQITTELSEKGPGKKRRLRRKKNKPKAKSLIPPIPTSKLPRRNDRHVARDLYVALRCCWRDARRKQLHRLVLVNWEGDCIMDQLLDDGNFGHVRGKLMKKIEGKVLIGHGLEYCLYSLQIQHPWANLRDGASYLPFMKETVDPLTVMFLPRSLSDLIGELLSRTPPEQSSPDHLQQEARACMDLYRLVRYEWENEITKLIQQKERQREVKLEHRESVPLSSISEHPDERADDVLFCKSPPITDRKRLDGADYQFDLGEDQSTQAPTEVTHESEDATSLMRDDLSVKSKTSDQTIWMPHDTAPEDGSKGTAGSWGLWLPRSAQESTHPLDADDWLNEDCVVGTRSLNIEDQGDQEESFGHLPSRLFSDSSSEGSDSTIPVREESNHFVEGMDWLEPDLGLRRPTKSRDGRHGRNKKSQYDTNARLWQNAGSIEEAKFLPRSHGETGRNRSTHCVGDDWLAEEREVTTPKFSFFHKRSSVADDSSRSDRNSRVSEIRELPRKSS